MKQNRFLNGLKNFLKKFIPMWIVLGVVAIFVLVDFINYSGYTITLVQTYTDENPEGDPTKLYFATPEKEETVYMKLQVTKFNNPVQGHCIVGVGQNGGNMKSARQITDPDGYVTFEFAVFPVFKTYVNEITTESFFYEEDSALVIEIRVEATFAVTLYRRD